MIARALDNDCYMAIASVDLSAAFDVVDKILIKRLKIIGQLNDVVSLIETWLYELFLYVDVVCKV